MHQRTLRHVRAVRFERRFRKSLCDETLPQRLQRSRHERRRNIGAGQCQFSRHDRGGILGRGAQQCMLVGSASSERHRHDLHSCLTYERNPGADRDAADRHGGRPGHWNAVGRQRLYVDRCRYRLERWTKRGSEPSGVRLDGEHLLAVWNEAARSAGQYRDRRVQTSIEQEAALVADPLTRRGVATRYWRTKRNILRSPASSLVSGREPA